MAEKTIRSIVVEYTKKKKKKKKEEKKENRNVIEDRGKHIPKVLARKL